MTISENNRRCLVKAREFLKTAGVLLVALAVVGTAALMPKPACAGPIKLNYANFPPAPTFPCVQMERWKTEVEKRTNGQVVVNTYPGGTLLDAKNMMDGVIAGQADIGCLCMAYQPGRFIVTNATALQVGFPNATVASLVLWDLYNKYKPEEFAKVKALTMFTCSTAKIYAKKPVRNLEDLKGLELRASGGTAEVLKMLGATPVGMPQSETPEALQKGVVQGAASSLETLKDFKYAEYCRYVTMYDMPVYPFAVVMNWDSWNSLPKDVQKVMDDLAVEQSEWTGKYMDDHEKESIEWSKKTYNIEIIQLSEDEAARWDKLLEPMTSKWVADASAKGIPAEEILKDINTWNKEYSQKYAQ
jgi:TRAP-type C4-dicarboxylate transport system substrate-binding protein